MCFKLIDIVGLENFMSTINDLLNQGWLIMPGQYSAYQESQTDRTHYTQMLHKIKK